MKKLKRIVLLCLVGFICLTGGESVAASQATTYTYTHDDKMNYSRTQDAYLPQQTITELGLNAPEDMFIDKNNMMYIADTGNLRIVKYDISRGALDAVYTYEGFQTPKGIYVTGNGNIYVADSKAKAVFVFDKDFELIRTLEKPEVPAYGDAAYEPSKVAADESGNIYIVGEGVYTVLSRCQKKGISSDFLR